MRYLTLVEVLELHRRIIRASGGSSGLRDSGGLESAIAQPRQTFDGRDLYPTLASKAATLAFLLIRNHPFVDGNKRIGHAALEVTLLLNGFELDAGVDEQERLILGVASSTIGRDDFIAWVEQHMRRVA